MRITPSCDWEPKAEFPKATPNGQDALLLVKRFPATAYRVEVAPGVAPTGETLPSMVIETGTGAGTHRQAWEMAAEAACGRILRTSREVLVQ